jgi:ADP-ribose pyrophosphatase YjhB (NUDIX family)
LLQRIIEQIIIFFAWTFAQLRSVKKEKHTHCSYCGKKYASEKWPRGCIKCKNITWRNPLPVIVLLVPAGAGLLLIRRGNSPACGELALPGGYIDWDEDWRTAGARELLEETNIKVDASKLELLDILNSSSNKTDIHSHMLIFVRTPPVALNVLENFRPNDEVTELEVHYDPIDLVFKTHSAMMKRFFGVKHLKIANR